MGKLHLTHCFLLVSNGDRMSIPHCLATVIAARKFSVISIIGPNFQTILNFNIFAKMVIKGVKD